MKFAEPYAYQAQFPNQASWEGVHPSYLTIGGSGVVGDFGAQSPMSKRHTPTWPKNVRAAGTATGDGSVAGAAPTYGGSGVA